MALVPDDRWNHIVGGVTPSGLVRPMSVEVLEELVAEWAEIVVDVEPFGGTELLTTARRLVVHSWFTYELLAIAALIGFQGVEAAFRQVAYPDASPRQPLRQLVDRAERDGIFPAELAEVIRAGVELRNLLAHPGGQAAFSLGMAGSTIEAAHLVLRDLCTQADMIATS